MHSCFIDKVNMFNIQFFGLRVIALLVLFYLLPPNNLQAQSDSLTTFLKVKLKDRSDFIGEQLTASKDSLIFRAEDGVIIRLHRSDIWYSYRVQPGKFKRGGYYPDLFNYDKGFVAPHAFGPKKGEAYFENSMLVWNELNLGVNDYISLRLGFDTWGMAMRIFDDSNNEYYEPVVLIAPKFSFPAIENKWYFAISPAIANAPDDSGFLDYGFLFLSNSFGNKNNNFTFGAGAQIFGEGDALSTLYITFSGNIRLSHRVALTVESWTIPSRGYNNSEFEYTYLLNGLGVKLLGQNLNWSISLVSFGEWGYGFEGAIPLVGVALPISRGGG